MKTTTTNIELTNVLRGIGFSENEALVYLSTLEMGQASIWDIAQRSGVKRTSCYVILDELALKGFASHTTDGRRTIWSVTSPKKLLQAIERRHERFTQSLSQLEGLASNAPTKPIIQLREGAVGVQEIYTLTLEQPKGSEICIYGTADVETNYGDFISTYLQDRVSRRISVRAILPDTPHNRKAAERDYDELRETRFLSKNQYNQHTEINIFGSNVAYIAHSESEPFATLITNATLAAEEKARFELLWNLAQPGAEKVKPKYVFQPYDPIYPELFKQEKKRIQSVIGTVYDIEHMGSTSVPGLGGKGIIDMFVVSPKKDMQRIVEKLQAMGYEYRSDSSNNESSFLQVELTDQTGDIRRYHIHVVHRQSPEYSNALIFRDYLRTHPEAVKEYAQVKKEATKLSNQDKDKYRKLKEGVIEKIMEEALR